MTELLKCLGMFWLTKQSDSIYCWVRSAGYIAAHTKKIQTLKLLIEKDTKMLIVMCLGDGNE